MEEIWKSINGFNGEYEISNTGRVKSKKFNKEKILKPNKDRYGYLIIRLFKNGKEFKRKVHRLVAEAFIPNIKCLPQVNHKNGNKEDNNVDNLEWCTPKENIDHAIETGLLNPNKNHKPQYGEKNCQSKITQEIADIIRDTYIPRDKHYGMRALARKYNLGVTTVRAIINNKTWVHQENEVINHDKQ